MHFWLVLVLHFAKQQYRHIVMKRGWAMPTEVGVELSYQVEALLLVYVLFHSLDQCITVLRAKRLLMDVKRI
jgi:hypothetical protein